MTFLQIEWQLKKSADPEAGKNRRVKEVVLGE
jgi:hypothetical protein